MENEVPEKILRKEGYYMVIFDNLETLSWPLVAGGSCAGLQKKFHTPIPPKNIFLQY